MTAGPAGPPSWLGFVQHLLDKALSSKVAFRRLIVLLLMMVTAAGGLMCLVLLCGGTGTVWSAVGGIGGFSVLGKAITWARGERPSNR
jgi:hypothetical protein